MSSFSSFYKLVFRTEHLNLIEALNGPIVRSETNTLSRASSMSNKSKRSSKKAINRQAIANEIFQERRDSSETSTNEMVELQDIVVQAETWSRVVL